MSGESAMKMSAGGSAPNQERILIRKKWIMNVMVFVIFVAASMIYYTAAGGNQVVLSVQETSLLIEVPKKSAQEVGYGEIRSMTLQEAPEYGTAIDGGTAGKCNYGMWQNEQWGSYYCYALTNVKDCIVLETENKVVVFNFENEDSTKAFYEAFAEKLKGFERD